MSAPKLTKVSPDRIATGERSRSDLGDLSELAASIEAIGLLHPVVVTADLRLVAGGRRLAAVRKLGWSEVPITVVDLTTAAETLRAEADENEHRKALTPLEAAVMRERRAAVLAGEAAKRKAQAPGKPRGERQVSSANLADETKPASATETRKVAALGTGYSGSTLDKVDDLRQWASDEGACGTLPGGDPIPVPPAAKPVVEKALRAVNQPGAAVSREHRKAKDAIEAAMREDPDIAAAEFRRDLMKAVSVTQQAMQRLAQFDAQRVADLIEDHHMIGIDGVVRNATEWTERIRSLRSGLRVVSGGRA